MSIVWFVFLLPTFLSCFWKLKKQPANKIFPPCFPLSLSLFHPFKKRKKMPVVCCCCSSSVIPNIAVEVVNFGFFFRNDGGLLLFFARFFPPSPLDSSISHFRNNNTYFEFYIVPLCIEVHRAEKRRAVYDVEAVTTFLHACVHFCKKKMKKRKEKKIC